MNSISYPCIHVIIHVPTMTFYMQKPHLCLIIMVGAIPRSRLVCEGHSDHWMLTCTPVGLYYCKVMVVSTVLATFSFSQSSMEKD